MNDIPWAMNSQQVTLMVLLDLRSAFHTVNYEVLHSLLLHADVGTRGKAVDWSYLIRISQHIAASQGTMSRQVDLDFGVP